MKHDTTPIARPPTDEEIQHGAYLLWIEEGRPEGRDQQHWFAAQEMLRHRAHAPASQKPARKASARPLVHL